MIRSSVSKLSIENHVVHGHRSSDAPDEGTAVTLVLSLLLRWSLELRAAKSGVQTRLSLLCIGVSEVAVNFLSG